MAARSTDNTRTMRTRGVCELTLESVDHERLAAFYRTILDMPVLSEDDDRIWLGCGPRSRLGLWAPGEKEFGDRGGHHVHFALSVDRTELQVAVRRLRALGHDFRGPVEHEGGDHSLYFEDPEGNVVELWDFFQDGDGADAGIDAF
ncbi:MAG TPA: VOC family protein [Solirubrobacteraceae bacterium]|nr:VOC family protein [Solirubrobacteraceae bacterium]